ncbi:nodulation protein NfeD [Salinisphaera sp.]|uniref:NfeD family protein n=1 Tax=Salinisphaera sp. TaxID=1914330 RepID=UPI002D79737B|nr:nodulation protein NfeD [Salinisphaera sp.]HET7312872.1 nodulation protein NfeD [Salinisphaera sp.]
MSVRSRRCFSRIAATALAIMLIAPLYASTAGNGDAGSTAREIPIDGAIGPAIGNYVVDQIEQANADHVPVIILRLDTPGGLSASMRDIVKAVLNSRVPVIGYVGPPGARAASAGTYILYATHIAAMAPATNLGAATPIEIGGAGDRNAPANNGKRGEQADANSDATPDLSNGATERRKQVNDAVAYIRSLAERRGRNADWAEKAVRQAASLSARQAAKRNVVDLIADNPQALLTAVDGRQVDTAAGPVTLHTANLSIDKRAPGWRTSLLAIITNPTVAYLLFMIGIVGLAAEALMPGATLPGTVGAISLIAALFAFHVLPVSYGGAALIVLGVLLFVAEAFAPSFGALGLGGIVAIVFGSIMLMESDVPGYDVSMGVIIGIAIAAALILALMVWLFARSRRARIETGYEGLVGRDCIALTDFERDGRVWLHGESWRAVSDTPVARDQSLIVTGVDGLTVSVRPRCAANASDHPNNAGRRPEGN